MMIWKIRQDENIDNEVQNAALEISTDCQHTHKEDDKRLVSLLLALAFFFMLSYNHSEIAYQTNVLFLCSISENVLHLMTNY